LSYEKKEKKMVGTGMVVHACKSSIPEAEAGE
jgi:hypothetical protein